MHKLKSVADLKRALVIGSKWESTYYGFGNDGTRPGADMGTRPVSIKQTNGVAFKTADGRDSWLYFQKRASYVFNDDGGFTCVNENGHPHLTYTPVNS